jgi:SAM-dependent methyltransferase
MRLDYPPLNLFDTTTEAAALRFARTAYLYDPGTTEAFRRLGVGAGWACLEVGDGGGSITEWLAHQVGPTGSVHSVDIDTHNLDEHAGLRLPWVTISRLDVESTPLPECRYDLVHARLTLMEVPGRAAVLQAMTAALRPGGWILVEDFDPHIVNRGYATRDAEMAGLHHRMCAAMGRVFAARGFQVGWGRSLHGRLRELGLAETGMTASLTTWEGGSPGALIDIENFNEMRDAVVAAGFLSDGDIDELVAALSDPHFEISSPLLCSAWGRRPAEAATPRQQQTHPERNSHS